VIGKLKQTVKDMDS